MYTYLLNKLEGKKLTDWQTFLQNLGLEADIDVTQTALLYDGDTLVATGSRQGNLLKCIGVHPDRQGEDLTSKILSVLRQEAFADGYRHLFLYTKPENQDMFSSLFFYPVAKTDKVLLMENRQNGISEFLKTLPVIKGAKKIGAIVVNCNPFTLGHRFLIETAAKECCHLYVFVVSEDKSRFSYDERMKMVTFGVADIENVTVLPTGPYLISSATFPTYFIKEKENLGEIKCLLDIEIFVKYFVPHFSITQRYIGTEPVCETTNQYNKALKEYLPKHNIKIKEIPRLCISGEIVSASTVRKLLDEKNFEKIKELVPKTTFNFLKKD